MVFLGAKRPPHRNRGVAPELPDTTYVIQHSLDAGPAETLADAAVKLRRLEAYVEEGRPARLLAGALSAVERAAR